MNGKGPQSDRLKMRRMSPVMRYSLGQEREEEVHGTKAHEFLQAPEGFE